MWEGGGGCWRCRLRQRGSTWEAAMARLGMAGGEAWCHTRQRRWAHSGSRVSSEGVSPRATGERREGVYNHTSFGGPLVHRTNRVVKIRKKDFNHRESCLPVGFEPMTSTSRVASSTTTPITQLCLY